MTDREHEEWLADQKRLKEQHARQKPKHKAHPLLEDDWQERKKKEEEEERKKKIAIEREEEEEDDDDVATDAP